MSKSKNKNGEQTVINFNLNLTNKIEGSGNSSAKVEGSGNSSIVGSGNSSSTSKSLSFARQDTDVDVEVNWLQAIGDKVSGTVMRLLGRRENAESFIPRNATRNSRGEPEYSLGEAQNGEGGWYQSQQNARNVWDE